MSCASKQQRDSETPSLRQIRKNGQLTHYQDREAFLQEYQSTGMPDMRDNKYLTYGIPMQFYLKNLERLRQHYADNGAYDR